MDLATRTLRIFPAVALAAGLALSGCGDDDGDIDAGEATGTDFASWCATYEEFRALPPEDLSEDVLERIVSEAANEIEDAAQTVADAYEVGDTTSEEVIAANREIDRFADEVC